KRLRNKDNAPEDLHFLTGGEFMLDDSHHMNLLYEYIKENDIKFVILDNLMTMLRNGDIIYGKDFEPMLRRITRLKLLFQDVTFLLVAHANKSAYANSMDD
ncbi:AAA family ATPase, partial [Kocuria sp. ZOR0020]